MGFHDGIRLMATRRAGVVTEMGVLARRALRSGRRGRVAAVFERSLYAVFGDDWICIGPTALGSGPLHVLCEGFAPDQFASGQEIAVTGTTLLFGGVELTGLDAAVAWSPRPAPDWTRETLHAGLLAVDDVWHVAPAEAGLAASGCAQLPSAPSRVLAAAAPGLAALKRLVEAGLRGNASRDNTEIAGLIGLGPGLTPSGDDLLGGALVALASLGFPATRDALWDACRDHLDRTNDISAAHLRSAAMGYAASALHEAIFATMGGRLDRIAPTLTAVSQIGHSSGKDAFAGALMVMRAVERRMLCGSSAAQQSVVTA